MLNDILSLTARCVITSYSIHYTKLYDPVSSSPARIVAGTGVALAARIFKDRAHVADELGHHGVV